MILAIVNNSTISIFEAFKGNDGTKIRYYLLIGISNGRVLCNLKVWNDIGGSSPAINAFILSTLLHSSFRLVVNVLTISIRISQ